MRILRILCIAAIMGLLLPVVARAAPSPISPGDYEARLKRVAGLLNTAIGARSEGKIYITVAQKELGETWEIQTSPPATADLRPVRELIAGADPGLPAGANKLREAVDLLDEHRQALSDLATATPRRLPDARKRLDEALKAAEEQEAAGNAISNWLRNLWRRLFGNPKPVTPADVPAEEDEARTVPWATWIALAIGAVGVGVLAWNLVRTLRDNAAGTDVALRTGGRTARPDRPPTPDELWEMAGRQAAAGDFKEGLRLAHLALLQHLDRSGLLRYLPSQTNREHESMLRRKQPDMARTMHQLNDLVESRLYSGHGATAEDYQRCESLAGHLWREGEALSKSAQAATGASSSASSS
ncbi:MAG TPA: DUF4129 domain-containing protein [Symbiobacteriaceae bacterium]|nr:DUF4129 domain-containing protein [Symbiobacteriaceae bacterium]